MAESKSGPSKVTTASAFANLGFEVLPFKGTEESVLANVPKTVRLSVTASPPKGIEATIALSEKLASHGYRVTPHLSAKMITGKEQLSEFVTRFKAVGIDSIFVVGGDAEVPAGEFTDALSLLKSLHTIDHNFTEIGIGGYPEGHHFIPQDTLDASLKEKAALATYIATQICFDSAAIIAWARKIKAAGVELPVRVGMPGDVSRQKLLRISLASGVGASLKFLQKQQGMFWRFFVPGGYSPNKLIRGLKPALGASDNNIETFHMFTFNEIVGTEAWRVKMLEQNRS